MPIPQYKRVYRMRTSCTGGAAIMGTNIDIAWYCPTDMPPEGFQDIA